MNLRLDDLIARSPGSQLIGYTFESKELRFQLFHAGEGALLGFIVPTDTVHGRTATTDPRRSTCAVEWIGLAGRLRVADGRYTPPASTAGVFADAKDRVTLAYGRRASEVGGLLLLQGDYILLACLVRDPAEIQWTTD